MSLLKVQDIHTYYGDSYILQGISLKVEKGSVAAVLGRNGMGKTTLIRSIMGFTPPRRGSVVYLGQDITHQAPFRINRLGIGLVPQGRRIFPSLTTRENLAVAARGNTNSYWSLDRVLGMFPQLKQRLQTRAARLSGGEAQMLAISRALMGNAALILMDEPSEGLAPIMVQEVAKIISQLKEQGLSILLVEQNLPLALKLADYVYVMSKGVIVHESIPKQLQDNTEAKSRYLGI